MKKLLVLALVLAVSTMASAIDLASIEGLSYVVAGDVVSIVADSPVTTLALAKIEPDAGALAIGDLGFATGGAGTDNPASLGYTESAGTITAMSGTTGSSVGITGTLYTFSFSGGTTLATIGTNSWYQTSSVAFEDGRSLDLTGYTIATPEPITVALLGLGGLFIRRRK